MRCQRKPKYFDNSRVDIETIFVHLFKLISFSSRTDPVGADVAGVLSIPHRKLSSCSVFAVGI